MYEGNHTCRRAALWNRVDCELRERLSRLNGFQTGDIANAVVSLVDAYAKGVSADSFRGDVQLRHRVIEALNRVAVGETKLSMDEVNLALAVSLAVFEEYRVSLKTP